MKQVLNMGLATLLIMGSAAVFAADDRGGPREGRMEGMRQMSEFLELTNEQEAQLLELRQEQEKVMLERRQAMRASREAGNEPPTREEMQTMRQAERAKMDEALQGILTDEQWTKLEEHRAERMERRGSGERNHDGMRGEGRRDQI